MLLNRPWCERPHVPRVPALRDVQRRWIAWRDARCGCVDSFGQGGSLAPVASVRPMAEATALRATAPRDLPRDAA